MTQLIACGVGQCGVQMAASFTNVYMSEASGYTDPSAKQRLFYETADHKYVARCVLIDTEVKAVTDVLQERTGYDTWKFDRRSIWAEGCGSRNNWAYGYSQNGFTAKTEVMDRLQHQAEKCDRFGGFMFFQSLAGGTGSGLGSRITECVRDTFGPRAQLVSNVVWPYNSGEVLVQNYNAVLTLSSLLQNSDAVTVTYNDVLHEICATQKGPDNVTFSDMNDVFSRNLSGVLLPSYEICTVPLLSQPLSHLVQVPTRRLLSLFSYPIESDAAQGYTNYQWSTLVENVLGMTATGNFIGKGVPTIRRIIEPKSTVMKKCDSLWVVLRGEDTQEGRSKVFGSDLMNCKRFFPSDNPDPILVSTSSKKFLRYDRYATVMANSQVIATPLEDVLSRFHKMFESAAFLHQYKEAGVDPAKMNQDRLFLEHVLHEYKSL